VYSHLTEVFNRCIQKHPTDAFDKFEEMSVLIKKTHLAFNEPKSDFKINEQASAAPGRPSEIYLEHTKWRKDMINGNYNICKEDAGMVPKNPDCCMPDMNNEADMLAWAGINFGAQDNLTMQHSLKKLACLSGASKLRFSGKIMGTERDYWIVCGELKQTSDTDPGCEPHGTGCNSAVFWVTDNLLHDWVQLPDVRPEHIIASR